MPSEFQSIEINFVLLRPTGSGNFYRAGRGGAKPPFCGVGQGREDLFPAPRGGACIPDFHLHLDSHIINFSIGHLMFSDKTHSIRYPKNSQNYDLTFKPLSISSPRDPPKKEKMAKVNKMEKQVNNLEKKVAKDSKVRCWIWIRISICTTLKGSKGKYF